MRKIIFILSVISFGISAAAQENYLSREAYRDKVEAYSQLLKQQRLKATASTEARKIAQTGFLPKIDITAEGTANLSHLDAWNSPAGQSLHLSGIGNTGTASLHRRFAHGPEKDCQSR